MGLEQALLTFLASLSLALLRSTLIEMCIEGGKLFIGTDQDFSPTLDEIEITRAPCNQRQPQLYHCLPI